MNKSELIDVIAEGGDAWTRRKVEGVVNTVFTVVSDALMRGDRVEIRGLGSFQVKKRLPRVGRNPKTGTRVPIPAQRVPSFTVGKQLKARVQQS